MPNFINLLGKRYNTREIFMYKSDYIGNDPIIRVSFIDRLEDLEINFDNCLTRDQFLHDMDQKMVMGG